ncbi:CBS domain-containing protein [Pacificimonas sp. WHA3]|uniref:CBS domain-containing protein n=1 Tax=Pacificimonas pallii TaxID=2827236 RepID=A0ABS6SIK0_9SPHN|nr:CBS domain-containing protein [Pacificimonas pallii]MBV7257746.1 CBS domain-containing protein [Pacificimonas pallii]
MFVGNIIEGRGDVISVGPDQSVSEVAKILVEHRIGAVLVMIGDHIAGIVSERDIVRCITERGPGILDGPASAIMTADVITVPPSDPVVSALSRMTRRRIRHLPVVEDAKLLGIVSIGDLVKRRIEEAVREADALKDYIAHS